MLSKIAIGQDTDSLLLKTYITPNKFYRVKIDGDLMTVGSTFKIDKRFHTIEIWAPNHKVSSTKMEFSSVKDSIYRMQKTLKLTEDYFSYTKGMNKYNDFRRKTFAYSAVSFILIADVIFSHFKLQTKKLDYIKAENGVRLNIIGYTPEMRDKLKSSKNTLQVCEYAFTSVAIMSAIQAYRTHKKRKKYVLPTLKKDNQFLLSNLGFNYSKEQSKLSLNIAFNF